jgi:hypothetical protein
MYCSLFKFTLALNSVLPVWKPMALEFLLGISEIFRCSMSDLQVKIVLPYVLQLLMLFVCTSTYLKSKRFLFIIFYDSTFLIMKMSIVFKLNVYIYIYIYIHIALNELLSSK